MIKERSLIIGLILSHIVVAAAGLFILWADHRVLILLVEGGLAASMIFSYLKLRSYRLSDERTSIMAERVGSGDPTPGLKSKVSHKTESPVESNPEVVAEMYNVPTTQGEQIPFLQEVFAASPSGIITSDQDGRIYSINPAAAELLRVSRDELQGLKPAEVASPLARQVLEAPVNGSFLLGQWGKRRLRCTHSQFSYRGSSRELFTIEDLTHELWASEKHAYESLIRTMSHEVNNSVGATSSIFRSVQAYGDQIRTDDRDDFGSALRVAQERMDALNSFMQRYADVVRVPKPATQSADLVGVLRKSMESMENECRKREVEMKLLLEDNLALISMDVGQMEQVFGNILQNAMEAIDHKGVIMIRVETQNSRISVSFEDSGPGFTSEVRESLFTPFFTTKEDRQGVGLTLVREILTSHGFDFSLESPPGGPTRFLILFDS